jgi:hypothetical protein
VIDETQVGNTHLQAGLLHAQAVIDILSAVDPGTAESLIEQTHNIERAPRYVDAHEGAKLDLAA